MYTLQRLWTPLHCAAFNGHVETLELLLNENVDPDMKTFVGAKFSPYFPGNESRPSAVWPDASRLGLQTWPRQCSRPSVIPFL